MTDIERYKGINYCIKCGAKLTLKTDREGKTRPICEKCGWVFYKNPVPASACVVFNEKNQLLLIKRKFEPAAGDWALPSGYVEITQTPYETSIEELLEETGIKGKVITFLNYFTGKSSIYEKVLSFGYLLKQTGGKLSPGDDAEEAIFYNLDNLPPIPFDAHRYFINKALEYKKMQPIFPNEEWKK